MFLLGCDPECFLIKDGHVVSAIGKIGGTKYSPKPILENYLPGFAVQEDNVLLEYNIPPAGSFAEFTDHLDLVHEYIDRLLIKQNLSRGTMASNTMNPDEMDPPEAWIFGCEPDFNAWTLKVNPKPGTLPDGTSILDKNPLFRSAGGHIHIGLENPTKSVAIATVRWLDRLVGGFLTKSDPDKERQKLYGAPGAMRFKNYGLEWRSPSNWWTFQSNGIKQVLFELIDEAVARGSNGKIMEAKEKGFRPDLLLDIKKLQKWQEAS